jgi:hypothetical protein
MRLYNDILLDLSNEDAVNDGPPMASGKVKAAMARTAADVSVAKINAIANAFTATLTSLFKFGSLSLLGYFAYLSIQRGSPLV